MNLKRRTMSRWMSAAVFGALLGLSGEAQAIIRTWDGGGADNNWNTCANWTGGGGGICPDSGDVAQFNNTNQKNCTINANISVLGINIVGGGTAYTGTITQAAGVTVTVGTSDYIQASGTFTGGDAAITFNDVFSLSGGTFTATSGTITAKGNWTKSGGTLNHNNGTVIFHTADILIPMSITGSHTLFNVTFAWADPLTIASGTTLTVAGTLTFNTALWEYQINTGTIAAQGNIVTDGSTLGTATLLINGTGNQTFTSNATRTAGYLPYVMINKPSGTLTLVGTFRGWGNWTYTAGTLDPGTSTVVFPSSLTISGSHSLNHVIFDPNQGGAPEQTIPAGTTLTVLGNLTLDNTDDTGYTIVRSSGLIGTSTIAVHGNVLADATAGKTDPLTTGPTLSLVGTNNQTLDLQGTLNYGPVVINKPSGTVTLLRNINLSPANVNQDLTVTAGTLDLSGYTLSIDGTLTNNGTIIASGAGTPIAAGTLTTSSTPSLVRYTGNVADGAVTVKGGTYGGLEVNNSGTTFILNGATTVKGNLSITAGSTLDASASNYALTLAGNWSNLGTFVPRSGTVTLNGTNQTLTGATTFYRLSKQVAGSDTLLFPAGITTTIQNALTLVGGAQSNPLYLRSSVAGSQAKLTLQTGGTQNITHVDVKDSDASGGLQLIAYDSVNSGNNLNWAFQALDLSSGLVGYWKFDETSGTSAADASGNGYTGSLIDGPSWAAGKSANAVSVDGVNDVVDVGSPAALDDLPAFTYTAWIYPGRLNADEFLVAGKDDSTANGTALGVGDFFNGVGARRLYAFVDHSVGPARSQSVNGIMTTNEWQFIASTWSGGAATIRLYRGTATTPVAEVSYAEQIARGSSTRPSDAAESMTIGARRNAGVADIPFYGVIDEVRVYNRVLSTSEIAGLAKAVGNGALTLTDPATASATVTNSPTVTTAFTSLESTATAYVLSNTSGSFGATSAIATTPSFTPGTNWALSSGDGEKFVYARITNGATTYDISDSITLDATAPAAPTGLTLTANSDNTAITATVTAPSTSDVSSLIWRYNVLDGNVSPSYPSTSTSGTAFGAGTTSGVTPSSSQSITASSLTQLKTYSVAVWAKDAAGNVSGSAAQAYLYLSPPTPRLVVTAPSSATSAPAGDALTLTITAKDANGSVITSYAGPYSLTWTPTGGTASTLVSSSTSGFSSGATTTSVTIGGSSAGPGTFTATDNSASALTNGTLSFTFYPTSFTVTTGSTSPGAGSPFTLTATAKDSTGTTVSPYSGTAALSVNYVSPTSGTKVPSTSSVTCSSGVCSVASMHYPDAGQITITAKDTTYVSGVTIQGTSATLTVKPSNLSLALRPLPASLTKVYVNQPFEMIVKALAADGQVTPNYRGTVTLSSTGASIGTATHTFVVGDLASYTFIDLRASSGGVAAVTATDGTVTSSAVNVSVRSAKLIFNPATGPPGNLYTGVYIKDVGAGQIVSEDQSTQVSVTLQSPTAGSSATLVSSSGTLRVNSGVVPLTVQKPDEGEVTITGSVQGFSMPVESATLKWATGATSTSTTTFQVLQFEQAPSTSTTYTYPTTTYTYPTTSTTTTTTSPTSTYYYPTGTAPTSTYIAPTSSFTPTSYYSAPTTGTFTYTSPTGVTSTQTVTSGGSRYDSAVSLGYTLVAPTFSNSGSGSFNSGSGSFSTFTPAFGYAPGTSSTTFAAPTGSYGGFFGAQSSGFAPTGSFSSGMTGPMFFGPSSSSGPMGMMGGEGGSFAPMSMSGPGVGMSFGPAPAAMRSKMEGMAQTMRDSGQLSATQFNAVMQGIQTGQPPSGMSMPGMSDGATGSFNPMTSGFMGPAPTDGSSSTAQGFTGPGGTDMSGFMVFNPSQGGWLTEGPTPESSGGLEETVEAGETEAAATDATATTTTDTGSSESTSATTSETDTTSADVGD